MDNDYGAAAGGRKRVASERASGTDMPKPQPAWLAWPGPGFGPGLGLGLGRGLGLGKGLGSSTHQQTFLHCSDKIFTAAIELYCGTSGGSAAAPPSLPRSTTCRTTFLPPLGGGWVSQPGRQTGAAAGSGALWGSGARESGGREGGGGRDRQMDGTHANYQAPA
ncbi:hypothetical protein Mp_7g07810 [Marchantia polymorpha subsp. ruderalis]|uniref:Uncharacterized protein n=2 Tax=Marchantia polymorpha TaxID=3197 RepID=A0AAF6BX77_MARPO|nr:hypothetical protein MARPO_0076s0013 [Marchantia polymorpha]BBN16611.1 hypothetical protein Mp_7g07810 [Marchantia polymorpha subsp. ruderalis]|eukprot:PTQ34766.1 hypothetical protein MARPO_0076s0013 [Marchantia polymorpha]